MPSETRSSVYLGVGCAHNWGNYFPITKKVSRAMLLC